MNQRSSGLILSLTVLLGVLFCAAATTGYEPATVDVIVGFNGTPDLETLTSSGGIVIEVYSIIPAVHAHLPQTALTQLKENPKIAYITENSQTHAAGTIRWAVERVGAPQAWSQSTGAGVKVAVLDSGVGPVNDVNVYGGYNFIDNNYDVTDHFGHGTMIAGIIAASTSSPLGVAGVAPDAEIYAVKVLNDQGVGTLSQAIAGIQWAVDNEMQIISMSWSLIDQNNALKHAVDAAYQSGLLLVAAAGNIGEIASGIIGCPANYDSVIAVSATKENNVHLEMSCVGTKIELAAPGENVDSIWINNQVYSGTGTSFSVGYVTGTAALVWGKNPSLTNVQVRDILDKTAVDLDANGRDIFYGFGLVNASAAVSATPRNTEVAFTFSPATVYANTQVLFDASGSFGGVNGFTTYTWNFGDGNSTTTNSSIVTHKFISAENFSVSLTVSNQFGYTNSTQHNLSVIHDAQAPVTSDNYDDQLHTSAFTITLTASDSGSGVFQTFYRINDGTTETLNVDGQPQITSNSLSNKIEYWSIDYAGNEETPHKLVTNIKLDTTPQTTPTPTQTPQPTTLPTNSPTPTPTLSPTQTAIGTLPPNEEFPLLLIVGVALLAITMTIFVVFWQRKK
ncbi:MAG: S8 family serine peptidase [Candidatus Bathyarchaeia archaeon]|jgi:subtilisin family serine protease